MGRKTIAVILATVVLIVSLALSVAASPTAEVYLNFDVSLHGEQMVVAVKFCDNGDSIGGYYELQYDSDVLSFVCDEVSLGFVNSNDAGVIKQSFSITEAENSNYLVSKLYFNVKSDNFSLDDLEIIKLVMYDENLDEIAVSVSENTLLKLSCIGEKTVERVLKSPTCTKTGVKEICCANCGTRIGELAIPMLEHNFGEWEMVKAPSEKSEGIERRSCSCGKTEERKIPTLIPNGNTEIVDSDVKNEYEATTVNKNTEMTINDNTEPTEALKMTGEKSVNISDKHNENKFLLAICGVCGGTVFLFSFAAYKKLRRK